MTTRELIREARKHTPHQWPASQRDEKPYCDYCSTAWPCLATRLADALEDSAAKVVRLTAELAEARAIIHDAGALITNSPNIDTEFILNLGRTLAWRLGDGAGE